MEYKKIVITTDGAVVKATYIHDGKEEVGAVEARHYETFGRAASAALYRATDYTPKKRKATPDKSDATVNVTINGNSIMPAQPDKTEPVKLYCASVSDGNKHGFTVGKVYTLGEDGCITDDTGYTTLLHWTSYECLKGRMFPLIKRPAKVGEWILPSDEWAKDRQLPTPCGIYQVERATGEYIVFDAMRYACDDEYLVLDGYQPEPEQPKYWSGRAVFKGQDCAVFIHGKVYEFKDGFTVDNQGDRRPQLEELRISSPKDTFLHSQFIALID